MISCASGVDSIPIPRRRKQQRLSVAINENSGSQPNGNRLYAIDVWCEDQHGTKLVDGDAKVEVARG